MGRLDLQLAAEGPVDTLDGLARGSVARGVHVVTEATGRAANDLRPVLVEGGAVLCDATNGFDPQKPRLTSGAWPEVVDHLLGRCCGEPLATQAGVLVELVPDDRALGHELRASLVDRRCLQQSLGGLALLAIQLRQLLLRVLDGAGHAAELLPR